MKNIKKLFQYSLLALFSMSALSIASPVTSEVSAKCSGSGARVFTFPTWYSGLPGSCNKPAIEDLNDFWIIVMNFIEVLLQLVAYVSAGFIVWGGFKYIKSEGDPGKISEAKMAIINAAIGLVIAMSSVALVAYISGRISA